ncbi:thiol:disulfide interchange protein [Gayadomonas joobiniege]|uniref:thiol:disulfide interchange protein n=1 Tax=Gayadomonas joobiniege TaxID=1234606 RepID=UPI0003671070|nr:thiol:disulfide interchange protein [Gayadomonas joobiniege]
MKHLKLFIPVAAFLAASVFFYMGLFSDPTDVKNANLQRPMPEFSLPDLMQPEKTYHREDLLGEVTLINVWGTWCVTCRVELPYMTKLRQQGIKIVGVYYDNAAEAEFSGINLQQTQADVKQMLANLGNPFVFNIYDKDRDLSLDLGVTGAPESFLIDPEGQIIAHRRGAIDERVWQRDFAPLVAQYQGK